MTPVAVSVYCPHALEYQIRQVAFLVDSGGSGGGMHSSRCTSLTIICIDCSSDRIQGVTNRSNTLPGWVVKDHHRDHPAGYWISQSRRQAGLSLH